MPVDEDMGPVLIQRIVPVMIHVISSSSIERLRVVVLEARMRLLTLSVGGVWVVSIVGTGVVRKLRTVIVNSHWIVMMARKSDVASRMDRDTTVEGLLNSR